MSKEREILKAGIWYTIGNILVKAISFIALPIFTNIMSTDEFGVFGTYQAYETIFSVIICLGISGTVRSAFNEFREDFERYISSITIPLFGMALLSVITVGILSVIIPNGSFGFFGTALVLNCLGNALREVYSSKFVIENKYKQNLAMSLAMSVLNITISYVLCVVAFSNEMYWGRIWGTVIASLMVAFAVTIIQYKVNCNVFWPKAWKFAVAVGVPLILHQLSISILGQCDKIMIQKMVDSDAAGIYTAMVTIVLVPQAIMISIENAWTPWFFSAFNKVDKDQDGILAIQKMNSKLVWLFSIIIIGFQLLCRDIVRIMVSPEYWSGLDILYILSISVFSNFLYIFSVNVEYYHKLTRQISSYTVIAAIINIFLNFTGIHFFGVIGAAVATALSRLLLLFLHESKAHNVAGYHMIRLNTLIGSLILVTVSAIMVSIIEDYMMLRILLAVIVTGIGCWFILKNFIRKDNVI